MGYGWVAKNAFPTCANDFTLPDARQLPVAQIGMSSPNHKSNSWGSKRTGQKCSISGKAIYQEVSGVALQHTLRPDSPDCPRGTTSLAKRESRRLLLPVFHMGSETVGHRKDQKRAG